jgi:hypothetical protein
MQAALVVPPGIVSHVRGVAIVHQQLVTPELRRTIVRRFDAERSQYSSITAFARAESRRLERQGVTYSANAINVLLLRSRGQMPKLFRWEQVLQQFRTKNPRQPVGDWYWHDPGDFPQCRNARRFAEALDGLRKRGYVIRRRPTSWDVRRERGWAFEYRLFEAGL